MAGGRKLFYTTICQIHGAPPKGQSYKEVKVPAPRGKMGSRNRSVCPQCKANAKAEKTDG